MGEKILSLKTGEGVAGRGLNLINFKFNFLGLVTMATINANTTVPTGPKSPRSDRIEVRYSALFRAAAFFALLFYAAILNCLNFSLYWL